ncbi:MAG: hypothetical protein ACXAEN_23845 [Candidatus Thorarchaeota archaeon]|jgi:hypothetical protein
MTREELLDMYHEEESSYRRRQFACERDRDYTGAAFCYSVRRRMIDKVTEELEKTDD